MVRTHRAFLLFILLVLFTFVVSGCSTQPPPEPGRYYNKDKGFSIKFPDGWEIEHEEDGTITAFDPRMSNDDIFYAQIRVGVEELQYKATLDEFMSASNKWIHIGFSEVTEEGRGELTIDYTQAKWIVYNVRMREGMLKTKMYFLVNGKRGYLVTCIAEPHKFPEYVNRFEEAVYSFRFE